MNGVLCRVFWGTHGCDLPRGHDVEVEPHACGCCDCDDHEANDGQRSDEDGEWTCVARPPYYGADTKFYGQDATPTIPAGTTDHEQQETT